MAVQDSIDPRSRTSLGRPAGYRCVLSVRWLGGLALSLLLAFQLAGPAHGSCGDYLEHGHLELGPRFSSQVGTDFQLAAVELVAVKLAPEQINQGPNQGRGQGRCRQGNCHKPAPAQVPADERVRIEDRRTDMMGPETEVTAAAGQQFAMVANQQTSPQAILDVAVPPPRF